MLKKYVSAHRIKEPGGTYEINPQLKSFFDVTIHGDAREALAVIPSQSVQAIVTSPPYFNQRDYGTNSQIGNEQRVEEYVNSLVGVFRECRRILKDDGVLWLNLGDKFLDGCLVGAPWRVALALISDGWTLRSDIIWHKPNAMPSSAKTRPTTDHEYIFLFSKSKNYYYDADAIREPHVTFTEKSKMRGGRSHFGVAGGTPEIGKNAGSTNLHNGRWDQAFHPLGRNKRTVWSIPLSKFRDAHFAVFPERLVETCIRASTREGDLVLDPFCGSGTTLVVAKTLMRHYLGLDSNLDYCKMTERRLERIEQDLFESSRNVITQAAT